MKVHTTADIPALLEDGPPCRITLSIRADNTQANVQEEGSTGWSVATDRSPARALLAVLLRRPYRDAENLEGMQQAEPATALRAAVAQAPNPARQRAVIRRPAPTAPTAPAPRRVVRRAP